ncbi:MAG: hypothetical protein RMJ15_09535, partial [Nitrososphaerota archaeon]|nr:hypothetical protein [Nitrososphaerota archaeon]
SLLKEAVKIFEDIRGFSLETVEVEVVTIDWAKENWGKAYAEPDIANIRREETIYRALFMISESESLYEARIEWWGMVVSAVWLNKIYVVKEHFNPSDKFNSIKTLIHELTHIMQGNFSIPHTPTFDGEKARAALIEGDARLMEEAYVNQTVSAITLKHVPVKACETYPEISFYNEPNALPESISRLNYFPYEYGLKFIRALYLKGGWKIVNQAYGNPPTTTEQVMHPEKYLANETFIDVESPAIGEERWQIMKNERFGEYFILVMLDKWIPTAEASKAAEGWGGDNFTYYELGDDYLFTWNITWDSAEDASDFTMAFQTMMSAVGAEKENQNFWKKYGRYISLKGEGNSTIIVGSTNKTIVQRIMA